MKWLALGLTAPLAVAALLILTGPGAQPADGRGWEPAEAAAWADPAGAEVALDLDSRKAQSWSRSELKGALTLALLRGDLTLAEAAEQFRAANVGRQLAYGRLPSDHPNASEEELSYRQVVSFVRGQGRVHPDAVAARLPGLEAEVARRFGARA